jgi:hypothetical protein
MVFKVHLIHAHVYAKSWYMSVLYIPHQKQKLTKYRWCTCSQWQIALIHVVSSTGMTYANMVSVSVEKDNIHIHTSPLIPQVASTHLTLRGQHCIRYENVFTSWGSDHKTSLGPHTLGARSWLLAQRTHNLYHTIGTVLKQTLSWGDGTGIHITRREDT